jgi:hypothetical protein
MEQEMVHGIIFMQQNQGEISETDFLKKSPKAWVHAMKIVKCTKCFDRLDCGSIYANIFR